MIHAINIKINYFSVVTYDIIQEFDVLLSPHKTDPVQVRKMFLMLSPESSIPFTGGTRTKSYETKFRQIRQKKASSTDSNLNCATEGYSLKLTKGINLETLSSETSSEDIIEASWAFSLISNCIW